ncbi:MAG: hypothetical protein KDC10_13535 [Calditrichaeota bacterium]|nr:hypothetical protein [Calditrichota bacterium]MCB9473167.1 hypothetical protein [Candidatus Delongbacteria bacterium]
MNTRRFLHLRLPHFVAAVESRLNPLLRERAFVVCRGEHDRSQLLGVSPMAAALGLKAGMLLAHARRRHPEILVVSGSEERSLSLGNRVLELLRELSPDLRQQGPSSFTMDLSACGQLHPDARTLGRSILERLASGLGLEGAIGIGASPLAAVFIARRAAAGEVTCLDAQEEDRLLRTFPVDWLPGVDSAFSARLAEMGIRTLGEARAITPAFLERVFGERGRLLVRELNRVRTDLAVEELDDRLVIQRRLQRDTTNEVLLWSQVFELVEEAADRLARQERRAGYLFLELEWSDGRRLLRGEKIQLRSALPTLSELRRVARLLLDRCLEDRRASVRSLQLQFSRLEQAAPQLDAFHAAKMLRQSRVERSLSLVKQRFGGASVRVGLAG